MLVYMLTKRGYIDGIHVTIYIYSSTMDPMGISSYVFHPFSIGLHSGDIPTARQGWHLWPQGCHLRMGPWGGAGRVEECRACQVRIPWSFNIYIYIHIYFFCCSLNILVIIVITCNYMSNVQSHQKPWLMSSSGIMLRKREDHNPRMGNPVLN